VSSTIVAFVAVTDKAALLAIPGNYGEMSYESFYGEDDSFKRWAGDLFAHEWEKAKPWYP
jgi:predicted transcriptional regulator